MQSNFVRALALVSFAPFLFVVAAPDASVEPQATQSACTYACPSVDLKGNQLDVDDSTISGDALTCFYGDASLALGCAYSIQEGTFRFGTSSDTESDSCPQVAVVDSDSECPTPEDGVTKSSVDITRRLTSMHRLSRRERYEVQRKREEREDEEDCGSDTDNEPSTGKRDVDDEDEENKDEVDCDDSEGEPTTLYTREDDEDEEEDDDDEENCDFDGEGPLNKRGDEEDEEEEECDEEN